MVAKDGSMNAGRWFFNTAVNRWHAIMSLCEGEVNSVNW